MTLGVEWSNPEPRRRVLLVTPQAGVTQRERDFSKAFQLAALEDSLDAGEAPFLAPLCYSLLDVRDLQDQQTLQACEDAWIEVVDLVVVYSDRGITDRMAQVIAQAQELGQPLEYRNIGGVGQDLENSEAFDGR